MTNPPTPAKELSEAQLREMSALTSVGGGLLRALIDELLRLRSTPTSEGALREVLVSARMRFANLIDHFYHHDMKPTMWAYQHAEHGRDEIDKILMPAPTASHAAPDVCEWVEIEEGAEVYNTCKEGEEFHLDEGMELWPHCHWCGKKIVAIPCAEAEPLPTASNASGERCETCGMIRVQAPGDPQWICACRPKPIESVTEGVKKLTAAWLENFDVEHEDGEADLHAAVLKLREHADACKIDEAQLESAGEEIQRLSDELLSARAEIARLTSPGVFGRDDQPQVMVYTAQIQKDMSHQCEMGWHQMVMFGEHQRALDKHLLSARAKIETLRKMHLQMCALAEERCNIIAAHVVEIARLVKRCQDMEDASEDRCLSQDHAHAMKQLADRGNEHIAAIAERDAALERVKLLREALSDAEHHVRNEMIRWQQAGNRPMAEQAKRSLAAVHAAQIAPEVR